MFNKFLNIFVRKRHYWRDITFSELAEIYTSMSLRSFGFGVIGIFVPIFLYKSGVRLQDIYLFYLLFFVIRLPAAYLSAYIIGRIGPKHSIAVSTVLIITFLLMLLSFNTVVWPLYLLSFFFSIANTLFFLAYHTDFSKIKDSKNGGKELGWLNIFERVGSAVGPVIGGLMATLISPEFTIVFAIMVLLGSLIPLFLTNEPVKVHQHIQFKGFNWHRHKRDFVSLSAHNVENVASQVMWPLYIAIVIFAENTYAKLGVIVGIATAVSIVSARMIGEVIDNRKGLKLLQYGTYINATIHILRSFTSTATGAIAISTINEPTTLTYHMPLLKGFYDEADSEPGYRIVYLTVTEIINGVAKAIYYLGLFMACYFFDPISVLRYSFIIVGVISLGMLFQRFPALKKV